MASSCRSSLSSSLASLLDDTIAAALFTEESMQTLPRCSQTQEQALTSSKSSEPATAVDCWLQTAPTDQSPDAASQESFVRDARPASPFTAPQLPLSTRDQPRESAPGQLSGGRQQEASSGSAQGVVDSAVPLSPRCTMDQSNDSVRSQLSGASRQQATSQVAHGVTDSATDSVTDSNTDSADLGSAAADPAAQHHSCNRAGLTGKCSSAWQGPGFHIAGPEKLASAEDGLVGSSGAASACNRGSQACSGGSSIASSRSRSSTPCSESSSNSSSNTPQVSSTACSEGRASPDLSKATAALRLSVDEADLGSSESDTIQPSATDVQTSDRQPPTRFLLAGPEASSNKSVTSPVDSSAPDDEQSTMAPVQDTFSTASRCEALQAACSRAEHAETLLSASISGADDISCSRVAATAVVSDAQTEVASTGVQTDGSLLACQLHTEAGSACRASSCSVEYSQTAQSAEPGSAPFSRYHSSAEAKQEAASLRHQSPSAGAAAESAHGASAIEDGLASVAVVANGSAMRNKVTEATHPPGKQSCMNNGNAVEIDSVCPVTAQAGMQKTGKFSTFLYENDCTRRSTTNSKGNVVVDRPESALLELVTACGGHNSLKELIRADMSCFPYERDCFLMSVCDEISGTFAADSS